MVVPWINARLERLRLREQRRVEAYGEIRALLDEAAQRLIEAETIWLQMAALTATAAASAGPSSELDELGERLHDVMEGAFRDDTRLYLRLGPGSSLVTAHRRANTPLAAADLRFGQRTRCPKRRKAQNLRQGHANFSTRRACCCSFL